MTICTQQWECFFEDDRVRSIAEACWLALPGHHAHVTLDSWVIMPNHLHGILLINGESDENAACRGVQLNAPTKAASTARPGSTESFASISLARRSLAVVIRTFKAVVTTQCRKARLIEFAWQRGYYDHVIRDDLDLNRIRDYIASNPVAWESDLNNPLNWQHKQITSKESLA